MRSDKPVAQWLKKRAVAHAVIVAFFAVPILGLLFVEADSDSILGQARLRFDRWENDTADYRIQYGRKASVNPEIIFLAIDAPSLAVSSVEDSDVIAASHPLSLMQGFPYPHELYPLIYDRLIGAGASVVAFDLFFPAPKPDDPLFKAAIDHYRDHVVIGMNFSADALRTNDNAHHTNKEMKGEGSSLTVPAASLFPEQDKFDDRLAYLNFWPDTDDVIRYAQYRTNVEHVDGQTGAEKLPALYSLAARAAQKAGHKDKVPIDLNSRMMRYAGPPLKPFNKQSYPLYQIFDPHAWKDTFDNGAVFRGKIVVIGPQADVLKDQLNTPYGLMDGVEIHLNALNALLQNDFLRPAPDWAEGVFVLCTGILAYLLAMGIAAIAWRFLAVVLIQGGYVLVLMWAYNVPGWVFPAAAPMFLMAASTGTGFIYDFVLNQLEKLRLRTTFERYTSPNVAKHLLDDSASYQEMLAGTRKPVTVLFSDVRGFTTLSEKSDEKELVSKLNEYLTEMVDCVFRYDGSLDKFIGDAVMAVWGNTTYNFGPKEDAIRAVRAARAMISDLRALNAKWVKEGRTAWQIGIGLNHGEVIVGDIGSTQRKEFAIIGDAVNLASRLESLTKEYHVDILLGESVAELVRDQFHLRTIDLVQVKGKTKAVETFSVLGEKPEALPPEQQKFLATYEEAIAAFRDRRFSQAKELLIEALKMQPDDFMAGEYLKDCEEFIQNPPDATWTGVRVMTQK